ncbi:XRE family transcriptional regulator [Frigidibacter sp. SD6-1]|uniref:helix-turn-helix domain-containing protein n=1 Tax=Frigidibacter sp. SD6-1 TaxID=3032581 RepID=UPI0024DFBAB3|nr:XRE family transcriptional regulator [Frigidibacter sp. SD6-1]
MDQKPAKRPRKAPEVPPLGRAIRHRRKVLGMTLEAVASAAELTTGFISQVERGLSAPSLSSLMAIAAALQTTIEQLVSVPEDFAAHVPHDKRRTFTLGAERRFYEMLGPGFAGALMHPQIVHRPAGHVSEKMCHTGEAFLHLLSGRLEYRLDDETHLLEPGDCIHHDTTRPHHSIVLGDEGSVELWVTTSPVRRPAQKA